MNDKVRRKEEKQKKKEGRKGGRKKQSKALLVRIIPDNLGRYSTPQEGKD